MEKTKQTPIPMVANQKCVVLLATCDKYEDTWEPFFALFNKFWGDCPYNIYINTETKDFRDLQHRNNTLVGGGNWLPISVLHPTKRNASKWGARMLDVLSQINSEYVFLVLDDFFLKSKVKTDLFNKCIDILDADKNLASIQLNAARWKSEGKSEPLESDSLIISEIPETGYKTHFNPTIWRKSVLAKWLRRHESIWGFEAYGSQRCRIWHYKERVLSLDSPVIYDYLWCQKCSVIVNGKWLLDQQIDDFFKEQGLKMDFAKRGRISVEEYRSKTLKDVLKRYTTLQKLERVVARIRSFF